MFRYDGKEGKVFRTIIDERVFLTHWTIVHIARQQRELLAFVEAGGHTTQHIHHLAVSFVAMQADGMSWAQFAHHDLHLSIRIMLHDVHSFATLEVRDDAFGNLVEIYFHYIKVDKLILFKLLTEKSECILQGKLSAPAAVVVAWGLQAIVAGMQELELAFAAVGER